jgi:uncharacterized damage-inducible protein DinB
MSIAQQLVQEIDHLAAKTRRVLERIPMDNADWKPHPKSMSIGKLAYHVATMAGWTTALIATPQLDFLKVTPPPMPTTTQELVDLFDSLHQEARQTLANASDEHMMEAWTLRAGDHVIFTLPRIVALRDTVINHTIHHTAQLTVYMRLLDIPVPGIYGPSADEH